jgi:hypothetical protein
MNGPSFRIIKTNRIAIGLKMLNSSCVAWSKKLTRMKMKRIWLSLIVAGLPLYAAVSQDVNIPAPGAAPAHVAPSPSFSPGVTEVVRLAHSGVGDEVVIAFVNNSQATYNLSVDDIVALKNMGFSSPVMAAMLNHDLFLRTQAHPPTPMPMVTPTPLPNVTPTPPSGILEATTVPAAPTIPATSAGGPSYAPATASNAQTIPPPPLNVAGVEQPPPAPRVEVVTVAPGPDYYWVGGYWRWNGSWVWVSGRWVVRPWHGAVWAGGHWDRHGHGYVWVDGHWH